MPQALATLFPQLRSNNPPTPAMQQPAQDHKPSIEMSLREHLLAAGAGQPTTSPQLPPPHVHGPSSPHAIDPAISNSSPYQHQMSAGDEIVDQMGEGRKGRRELSTSKRAAQNRAAQRAFRQRKEEYIKQLKDQVQEFDHLCELYKNVQTENYQLRDYIISLQSRLLEAQGEIPPAPAGVDLTRGPIEPPSQLVRQTQQQPPEPSSEQPSSSNGGLSERQIGELQMAAQAAAAAQHGDYSDKRPKVENPPVSGGPVGEILSTDGI